MEPYQPKLILVPTDFSEPAVRALRYASAFAQRFGAHLLVIYADPFISPVDFMAIPAGTFDESREVMMEKAREELQSHAEENIASTVPFDLRVVVGTPAAAIVEVARSAGANLVIMGTHGRSGVSRLVLGSVTESVMRMSPAPVIAVNASVSEDAAHIHKVLSPVTFTAESRSALLHAASLVTDSVAPMVLLGTAEEIDAHMGTQSLMRLQKWIPIELAGRCETKLMAPNSDAGDIVGEAVATGANLIALGVEPDRTVFETLRGTLAERVVQQSSCPVLVVNSKVAPVALKVARERLALA